MWIENLYTEVWVTVIGSDTKIVARVREGDRLDQRYIRFGLIRKVLNKNAILGFNGVTEFRNWSDQDNGVVKNIERECQWWCEGSPKCTFGVGIREKNVTGSTERNRSSEVESRVYNEISSERTQDSDGVQEGQL